MSLRSIVGCMLGCAVGDAIGLPYEGLSKRRGKRLLGPPNRHRFFFGRGMVSDDTEHTCMVAQSLIVAGGDRDRFRRSLAWRFRWWLLLLPAGIGFATLRAIVRLWVGYSPERSGVFSAGNGPAMRAAIIGAAIDDRATIRKFVRDSARVTHSDPKAEFGAFAVALAARMARDEETVTSEYFATELRSQLGDEADELHTLIAAVTRSVTIGESTAAFAESMGLEKGVTGYVYHSAPVAIHAWLSNQNDFRAAVTSIIACGGDADSTAAIVGGIIGSRVGEDGIPADWLAGLMEWPCSTSFMKRLGNQLYESMVSGDSARSIQLPIWALLPRNLFFVNVVLFHGFRRLLPPY